MMLSICGSWPISGFTALIQEYRTRGEGAGGKKALPGMIILKGMRLNTEFFFGPPSFRIGLVITAGYLDIEDKACHYI